MTIDITSCRNCPAFWSDERNGEGCNLATSIEVDSGMSQPPSDCPLRTDNITLRITKPRRQSR